MTVYLVISLPKSPYIHRIYMVLANPMYLRVVEMWCYEHPAATPHFSNILANPMYLRVVEMWCYEHLTATTRYLNTAQLHPISKFRLLLLIFSAQVCFVYVSCLLHAARFIANSSLELFRAKQLGTHNNVWTYRNALLQLSRICGQPVCVF